MKTIILQKALNKRNQKYFLEKMKHEKSNYKIVQYSRLTILVVETEFCAN